ncbi:winged helix-turn-helix domain-containing protein [Nocardioides agariphilus]|jgi:hypothetical protein|uniref:Winged helix-turn-helix domain-containing protein n=1 Tax=Nocardioides agariphilus TaxID=433664 RepID=A0A930YF75_9ACTN|nr:winged helix-turn-helix domain-containing protein [Nocardioides agariphilus]MBF4766196.1 winged helix-turn-helix domain-containing protein [Nocardioides agariphilus]
MGNAVTLKGRERELASLERVLDANGPRVAFVYGVAGIGKSALLDAFATAAQASGTQVLRIDCAAIDPTESSFRAALDAADWHPGSAGVVIVDTYEMFRIADPWLRHELLVSLPADVRFVIAGRDAPMLEWSTERGRLGGLEILPLVGLTDDDARAFLADANVAADHVDLICRIARGHPLSLRLAAEAEVAHMPIDEVGSRVVAALATAFRAGLDEEARRLLDAASVPRRVTRGVLEAMTGRREHQGFDRLGSLSFVDETSEGLRLHDAVQAAVSARLRALEPERFRELRSAAWHHLQQETRRAGAGDLHRFTADLLFLIDNPFVREAMFPATTHAFSVERSREEDADALRALWHEFETPQGASVLDAWLRLRPEAVRSVRDRTGAVVGCSIVAEWRDIPHSLERADPVVAAWSRHAARHPLPPGQRTLTHRRWLAADTGERPSGVQAAALLDVKRDYFRLRPHLGRLYVGVRDPRPFVDALRTLGFRPFDEPIDVGGEPFHLAALDFGPDSVDGWLNRIAAAELGESEQPFLDELDRSVDVGGARIQLSRLEFGVLSTLAAHPATPVSRADLLREVWGTSYQGGSNTVDVVIRSIRRKLGPVGDRVDTVRGVGYRLR